MRLVRGCHVCGKPTTGTCYMCGQPACSEHTDRGICTSCAQGMVSDEKDNEPKLYGDDIIS